MASLLGNEGFGLALTAKPDPIYEKMALAEAANADKAAQKQQDQINAYTNFISDKVHVSGDYIPAIAKNIADDGKATMADILQNPKDRQGNALKLQAYQGRVLQQAATNDNVKTALKNIGSYDTETQQAIQTAATTNDINDLRSLQPNGQYSNFQNNNGVLTFTPLPKLTDENNSFDYINKGTGLPQTPIKNFLGNNQIEFIKISAVPKDKADLQDKINTLKANGMTDDQIHASGIDTIPTAQDKATHKFSENGVADYFKSSLHNNFEGKTAVGVVDKNAPQTNKELFYKDGDISKPYDKPTVYNNLKNEYIKQAKNAVDVKVNTDIRNLLPPKTEKVTGNAGEGNKMNVYDATDKSSVVNKILANTDNTHDFLTNPTDYVNKIHQLNDPKTIIKTIGYVKEGGNPVNDWDNGVDNKKIPGRLDTYIQTPDGKKFLTITGTDEKTYLLPYNNTQNISNLRDNHAGINKDIDSGFSGEKSIGKGGNNPKTTAPKVSESDWNDQWSKLKSGETLIGLDGVPYKKK